MKTLIVNGSPRKNGNTAYLTDILKDDDTHVVNVFDMSFKTCVNCGRCIKGSCVFNDDASRLIEHIDDHDSIIIATPLYYNQPAGPLMSLMSRNQIIYNKGMKLKPKKGGIIVTGGGETVINSADAERTIRIMLKSWNTEVVAYVRSLETGRIPAWEDEKAIKEAAEMKKKLS